MANALFRKKSLDRLSSPEQLDKMIVVNSPMTWLALAAGAAIIAVVILWGVIGRVPITEEGKGILLTESNITSVYAKTQGVVTNIYVSSGDYVEEGDVLYEVGSTEVVQAINQLGKRIAEVEAVTYDSENDVVTSDNQTLLEIKRNKLTLSLGSSSSATTLNALRREYEQAQSETASKRAEMEAAESAYYQALASDNSSSVEYDYSAATEEYQAAEAAYQAAKAAYEAQPDDEKGKGKAKAKLKEKMEKAEAERDEKEAAYEEKKAAYENYIGGAGSVAADRTEKSNAYNTALSQYTAAKSKEESLRSELKTMEAQHSGEESAENVQRETLQGQFDATKEAMLNQLNTELNNYEQLKDEQEVKATVSGTVYSTFVTNGSTVAVDTEMARISQQDAENEGKLQAIYFMSLAEGKNVREGMKVNVYATSLPKEEYGHMTATVTSVANYVTSYADLRTRLGDETLASTFSSDGAVLQVVCELDTDPNTASGFEWSTAKGKKVELEVGTLLEGSVITEEVPPITMLIPKLKEKFHME